MKKLSITKKAVLLALTLCLLTTTLSGCASGGVHTIMPPAQEARENSSLEPAETQTAQETPPPETPAPTYDIGNVYTSTWTDRNGHKIQATLKIGSWIKGSDDETLNKAWEIAGGTSGFPSISKVGYRDFNMQTAVFAVGTVSVRNITPGYDITGQSSQRIYIGKAKNTNYDSYHFTGDDLGCFVYGRQAGGSVSWEEGTNAWVTPVMTQNSWGPVPVFFGVERVHMPKYPDGNPGLDEYKFAFWGSGSEPIDERMAELHLDKTW